jgi:hypothetical protein
MSVHIYKLPALYQFPLGRCVFALRQVEKRARNVGQPVVASLARACIDEAKRIMALALRFTAGRDSVYSALAISLDVLLDRCIGGVDKYLEAQIRIYANEARAESAATLSHELLPEGVAAVVHLPYTEQHSQVGTLLERAQEADLAPHVQALPELPDMLDRLGRLNDQYGEALGDTSEAPTREQVDQGKKHCQALLVGKLVSSWPG